MPLRKLQNKLFGPQLLHVLPYFLLLPTLILETVQRDRYSVYLCPIPLTQYNMLNICKKKLRFLLLLQTTPLCLVSA